MDVTTAHMNCGFCWNFVGSKCGTSEYECIRYNRLNRLKMWYGMCHS